MHHSHIEDLVLLVATTKIEHRLDTVARQVVLKSMSETSVLLSTQAPVLIKVTPNSSGA